MDFEEFVGFLRILFKHQIPTKNSHQKSNSSQKSNSRQNTLDSCLIMFDYLCVENLHFWWRFRIKWRLHVNALWLCLVLFDSLFPANGICEIPPNSLDDQTNSAKFSKFHRKSSVILAKTLIPAEFWRNHEMNALGPEDVIARLMHVGVSGLNLAGFLWTGCELCSFNSKPCHLTPLLPRQNLHSDMNLHSDINLHSQMCMHFMVFTSDMNLHSHEPTFTNEPAFTNVVRHLMWYMHSQMWSDVECGICIHKWTCIYIRHEHQTRTCIHRCGGWLLFCTSDMNLHSQTCMQECVEQCRLMYAVCMHTYECMHACTIMSACAAMNEVDIAHACTLMHSDPMN